MPLGRGPRGEQLIDGVVFAVAAARQDERLALLFTPESLGITTAVADVWELLLDRARTAMAPLLDARRTEPRDDLMSALLGLCFLLLVAGNETTTNLISNAAVILHERPDVRRHLAKHPEVESVPGPSADSCSDPSPWTQ